MGIQRKAECKGIPPESDSQSSVGTRSSHHGASKQTVDLKPGWGEAA